MPDLTPATRLRRRALLGGTLAAAALTPALAACGSATTSSAPPTVPRGGPDLDSSDRADYVRLIPHDRRGPVVQGDFRSAARGGVGTPWAVMYPPGSKPGDRLPVAIALHGHGGSVGQLLEDWRLPRFLAAAVNAGAPPFAIAAANGGTSFWHPRPWGEDASAMITDELMPRLAERGLAVDDAKVGLIGWSMGGYGVLYLGGLLGPDRVAAIVAESPGLYTDPTQAHPDGFVDAAEYEQYSVMHRQQQLAGIPLRVDVGTHDYFYPAVHTYLEALGDDPDLVVSTADAGHAETYSVSVLPADLAFLGQHL